MSYPFIIVVPALKVSGVALFPFILIKHNEYRYDKAFIRHETIHLRQELELLILPFYILYLFNYLLNRFKYHDHDTAYMNIVFEREAYARESDRNYLSERKFWAWLKFIKVEG
jgi:hypothetical protein